MTRCVQDRRGHSASLAQAMPRVLVVAWGYHPLVTPPAAWPLQLPLTADVHRDQERDSDRVEDPVDPVAVREVPKAHAGLDRADETDHPTLRRKRLHLVSVPAIRNLKRNCGVKHVRVR